MEGTRHVSFWTATDSEMDTHLEQGLDLRFPSRKVGRKLLPRHVLHPGRIERRVLEIVPRDEGGEVDEGAAGDGVRRDLLSTRDVKERA